MGTERSGIMSLVQELHTLPSPSSTTTSSPSNSVLSDDDENFQIHISTLIADEFQRSRPASGLTRDLSTMPPPIKTIVSKYTDFDFRSLEYLPDYDSRLMCPVCHVPLVEPRRLACDHIFCNYCFNLHLYTTRGPAKHQCPTCRAETASTTLTVPRIIINMCNDVKVYCLNRSRGCEEIMTRETAPHHVSHCGYQEVKCPKVDCERTTLAKDIVEGKCRHGVLTCNACMEVIMDQDLAYHEKGCTASACPSCGVSRGKEDHLLHAAGCKAMNQACNGSAYGCNFVSKGDELHKHEDICLLAKLAPHLSSSAEQISSLKSDISRQKTENERLLSGNQRLWEIMIRHIAPAIDDLRSTARNIASMPSPILPGARLPNSSELLAGHDNSQGLPDPPQMSSVSENSVPNRDQPLYANRSSPSEPLNHLLSLHESLRSDVVSMNTRIDYLTASLHDLISSVNDSDSRANMMVLNDVLRIKEDLAHTNAALFGTRAQVNWLTRLNGMAPGARRPGISETHDGVLGANSNGENLAGPSSSNGPASTALIRDRSAPDGGRRPSDGHSSQEKVKL